jgi:chromosome segregation ATPase
MAIRDAGNGEIEGVEGQIEEKERRIAEREGEIGTLRDQIRAIAARGEELKRIVDDLMRENERLG